MRRCTSAIRRPVGAGVAAALAPGLRVDRSFRMAIRERHSGTILFLVVIDDPSEQS